MSASERHVAAFVFASEGALARVGSDVSSKMDVLQERFSTALVFTNKGPHAGVGAQMTRQITVE
jgi:hypothetical protein